MRTYNANRLNAIIIAVLLTVIVGCAGYIKLTPIERARVTCGDLMDQYTSLYNQSKAITANTATSPEFKATVITKVNPKLNTAHTLIVDYCEMAIKGTPPDSTQIVTIITDVTTMIGGAK